MVVTDIVTAPDSPQSLADMASEWRALARRTAGHSLCQTYEYAATALEQALRRGARAYLLTLRDGETLRGVWGLTLSRSSFRSTLAPFSSGTNEEYSGPLLDAGGQDGLAERMLRQAASISADRLMLYNLTRDGAMDRAAIRSGLPQKCGMILGCAINAASYRSWHDVERALSRSFRSSLRRDARRLSERGQVAIGWSRTVEDSDRVLEFFFASKRAWLHAKDQVSPWLGREDVPAFFRSLVRCLDLDKTPVVAFVKLDGEPIAACACLVSASAVEYYMTTFDPDFAAFSPGKMLLRHLIEWALDRRLNFDFRIMMADYKKRWPVEVQTYHTRTLALTPIGQLPEPANVLHALRSRLGALRRRIAGRLSSSC